MTTAFLYDERFLEHNPGAGHPERRHGTLSLAFEAGRGPSPRT